MSNSVITPNKLKFHMFRDERFIDLNLYQFGWERTDPCHSYGPHIRNHYLFHYVISGKGKLFANEEVYDIGPRQGFLIVPGQITTYRADEQEPWEYTWLEFDGLRAHESIQAAGISGAKPVYTAAGREAGQRLQDEMLYIVNHGDADPIHLIGHGFLFLEQLAACSATRRYFGERRLRDFYLRGGADLHRPQLPERYFHRGHRRRLRAEPQLFRQNFPGYGGRKPAGISAALPHGSRRPAAQGNQTAHRGNRAAGGLRQPAAFLPRFQKCTRGLPQRVPPDPHDAGGTPRQGVGKADSKKEQKAWAPPQS